MSFQLTVPVNRHISSSVMGRRIKIENTKDANKHTFHRETILNMSEAYNISINYDKLKQEFVLSGQDKEKVEQACEALLKLKELKQTEHDDFVRREKRRKEEELEYRFRVKQQELYDQILYKLEHADEIKETEHKLKKLNIISSSNAYYGLELLEDGNGDGDIDVDVHANNSNTQSAEEKQNEKLRKTLLRRIKYFTKLCNTKELQSATMELSALDGKSDTTALNSKSDTEQSDTEQSDTEQSKETEDNFHSMKPLETINEFEQLESDSEEESKNSKPIAQQLNEYIKNKEDSHEANIPRNRGYYQRKYYPKRNDYRNDNRQTFNTETKTHDEGWTNVGGGNNFKSRPSRDRGGRNHSNGNHSNGNHSNGNHSNGNHSGGNYSNKPHRHSRDTSNYNRTDLMDEIDTEFDGNDITKLPHNHIRDKLDELIGSTEDYECMFPPLLNNTTL